MAAIAGTTRLNAFNVHLDNIQLPASNWSRNKDFTEDSSIDELMASLRATGLQVPLRVFALKDAGTKGGVVARKNEKGEQLFEVRQGQRRTTALKRLWADGVRILGNQPWDGTVPCLLSQAVFGSVEDILTNIAENTGRVDADPVARAESLAYLVNEHKLTIDQIAEQTGYARDLVSDSVKLQSASPAVQTALTAGDLPWSTIRTLVRDSDHKVQEAALDAALEARKAGGNVTAMRNAANAARGVGKKVDVVAAPAKGIEDDEDTVRRAPGAKRIDVVIEKLEARIEKLQKLAEKHKGQKKAHSQKEAEQFTARVAELRVAIRLCRAAQVIEAPAEA